MNPGSLFLNKSLMTVCCIVPISSLLKKVNPGFQSVRFQLRFYCIYIPSMHIIILLRNLACFDSSLFNPRSSLYRHFHVRYKLGRIWEERMKSAKWKSNPGIQSTTLLHICYGKHYNHFKESNNANSITQQINKPTCGSLAFHAGCTVTF